MDAVALDRSEESPEELEQIGLEMRLAPKCSVCGFSYGLSALLFVGRCAHCVLYTLYSNRGMFLGHVPRRMVKYKFMYIF